MWKSAKIDDFFRGLVSPLNSKNFIYPAFSTWTKVKVTEILFIKPLVPPLNSKNSIYLAFSTEPKVTIFSMVGKSSEKD